jgi:phenylacetate-CoA ligase
MVINEELTMEIAWPGANDPIPEGEIVVASLEPGIRLALADLTAALTGASPCGRSNMRIRGWMGRVDQSTKVVKGLFVQPEQIAEIGKRHRELERLGLVVTREGESNGMTLKAQCNAPREAPRGEVTSTLRAVSKLQGRGGLSKDGKVILDERKTDETCPRKCARRPVEEMFLKRRSCTLPLRRSH